MKSANLNNLNWRYVFNTRRFLLAAAGCALLSLVLVMMVIVPQFNQILINQSKIDQEKKTLGQLQNKMQALGESNTLDLVNQSKLVDSALPSHKPLLELMSSLNFVASWAQINITDIQLSPGEISTDSSKTATTSKVVTKGKSVAAKAYQNLDVDLTVEGELDRLNMFLKNVENTVPFSTVTKFTLAEIKGRTLADGSNTGNKTYKAELTISTYYFTQSVNAALISPLTPVGNNEQALLTKLKSYTMLNQTQQKEIQGGGSQDLFGIKSLTGESPPKEVINLDEETGEPI